MSHPHGYRVVTVLHLSGNDLSDEDLPREPNGFDNITRSAGCQVRYRDGKSCVRKPEKCRKQRNKLAWASSLSCGAAGSLLDAPLVCTGRSGASNGFGWRRP